MYLDNSALSRAINNRHSTLQTSKIPLSHLVKRACDVIGSNSRKQRREPCVFIVVFSQSFAASASCYHEDVCNGFKSKTEQCILN